MDLSVVPYLGVIVQGLIAAHALALFVVNLTPTPDDDHYLSTAYSWIEFVAGLIHPNAKS